MSSFIKTIGGLAKKQIHYKIMLVKEEVQNTIIYNQSALTSFMSNYTPDFERKGLKNTF